VVVALIEIDADVVVDAGLEGNTESSIEESKFVLTFATVLM
jgi:hypothetical protein